MRYSNRRLWLAVLMAVIAAVTATGLATAKTEPAPDYDRDRIYDKVDVCPAKAGKKTHDGCPRPYVVGVSVHKPPKRVKKVIRGWDPWPRPTVPQVYIIMAEEQRKWGGPSLVNRVSCESSFYWGADNGTYEGLLQFGPIWDSMYARGKSDRKVVYRTKSVRKAPKIRFLKLSNGKLAKKVTARIKQRIFIKRIGMLPRDLYYSSGGAKHGWAAIRTGQRAVSGAGPTTGWECGL